MLYEFFCPYISFNRNVHATVCTFHDQAFILTSIGVVFVFCDIEFSFTDQRNFIASICYSTIGIAVQSFD